MRPRAAYWRINMVCQDCADGYAEETGDRDSYVPMSDEEVRNMFVDRSPIAYCANCCAPIEGKRKAA